MYNIQNTEENFKKLEHVIENRNFTIYKQILCMIIVELWKKMRQE